MPDYQASPRRLAFNPKDYIHAHLEGRAASVLAAPVGVMNDFDAAIVALGYRLQAHKDRLDILNRVFIPAQRTPLDLTVRWFSRAGSRRGSYGFLSDFLVFVELRP